MDIGGRRFTIEAFGLAMMMQGCIESRRRLTELANEDDPFLSMRDVHAYAYSGDALVQVGQRPHGVVSKDSIVMLTERDADIPVSASSAYLRVPKSRIRIQAYTGTFSIEADIHLPADAEVEQFLTVSKGRFVPVTDATATPIHQGTPLLGFKRPFMLLNRDHIAFLGPAEAEVAVAQTAPDLLHKIA